MTNPFADQEKKPAQQALVDGGVWQSEAGTGKKGQKGKAKLRGRYRISQDACVETLNPRFSQHSATRGQTVYGVEFTPNPSAADARVFRLFTFSPTAAEWLRLAIEANIAFARGRLGGLSSETEYKTLPGVRGRVRGWFAGGNMRGKDRPCPWAADKGSGESDPGSVSESIGRASAVEALRFVRAPARESSAAQWL